MKSALKIINAINAQIFDLTEQEENDVIKLCKLYNAIPETAAEKITERLNQSFPIKVEKDLILNLIQ